MDLFIGADMGPDATGKYTSGTVADMSKKDDTLSQGKSATISVDLL